MDKFRKLFGNKRTSIIGMIHLKALPGTPQYESGSFSAIIEKARHEANIYAKYKLVS
jgi:predicted TIM-barrel enzyme